MVFINSIHNSLFFVHYSPFPSAYLFFLACNATMNARAAVRSRCAMNWLWN